MSATTTEPTTGRTTGRTTERRTWTCDNCRRETTASRKRCADCGTSRW